MQKWKWLWEVEKWYWRAFLGACVVYVLLVIGLYQTRPDWAGYIFDFEVTVFTTMLVAITGIFLSAIRQRVGRELKTVTPAPLWLRIVVCGFLVVLGLTTAYSAWVGFEAQVLFTATVLWALSGVCLLSHIQSNIKILNPYVLSVLTVVSGAWAFWRVLFL